MTNPDRQAEAREVLARHLREMGHRTFYDAAIASMLEFAALVTKPSPAEGKPEADHRNCGLPRYGAGDHSEWCMFKPDTPTGGYADGKGREAIADIIAAKVSGPATQDFEIQQAHRLDQLAAADAILALLPSQKRMREAATEMLIAFAEGVVWNDEQRAAYQALSAALASAGDR